MKKSGRGAVCRAFIRRRRYYEDEEYREKYLKSKRDSRKRNPAYQKKYEKELSKFFNKRCKICDKLLNHRTKTGICKKHFDMRKRLRNPIILMFYRLISKLQ